MLKAPVLAKFAFFLFVGACWTPALFVFNHLRILDLSFFKNTQIYIPSLLQALASTVFTLGISFFLSWGLLALRRSWSAKNFLIFEYFLLLPSFVPPLIVIVSVLSLFSQFPFGFWGVVLMHGVFEVGLVSVFLSRWLVYKLEPYNSLFILHPQSVSRRWSLMGSLLKTEITMTFGFLFIYFLTSLSVPMILSGQSYTSIELTMYNAVRNSRDWDLALHLYALQILMILPFLLFIPKKSPPDETAPSIEGSTSILGKCFGFLGALPSICVLIGLIIQAPRGFAAAQREGLVASHPLLGSLLMGFFSAGLSFLFLSVLVYFYQHREFRKLLRLWTIPSFVMVGFFFESVVSHGSVMSSLFWASVTLVFLFAPTLARLGLYQQIEQSQAQLEMATVLGASPWKIFCAITFPVVQPWLFVLSGVSALWAMGDFAILRLFVTGDVTLGLKIQSLIEQYRWDQAVMLSWYLLGACSLVFLFFGGFAFVAAQKLK